MDVQFKKWTVYVVDDDEAARANVRRLAESVGVSVETYSTPDEFLRYCRITHPGCLVLDVRLPGLSGLALQERLVKQHVDIPVIFVTSYGDVPTAVQAVKKGAMDFIEKPFHDHYLLERIQEALEIDAEAQRARDRRNAAVERFGLLTKREREVLDRVVAGAPNKAIALDLGISQKTVEFHRSRIMSKIGASCVADLVRFVMEAKAV